MGSDFTLGFLLSLHSLSWLGSFFGNISQTVVFPPTFKYSRSVSCRVGAVLDIWRCLLACRRKVVRLPERFYVLVSVSMSRGRSVLGLPATVTVFN